MSVRSFQPWAMDVATELPRRLCLTDAAALLTALMLLFATASRAGAAGISPAAVAAGAAGTAMIGASAASAASATIAANAGPAQYALIVNGDDSFTHNYNVALAATSLARLGYAARNTLILAPAPAADLAMATGSASATTDDADTKGGAPDAGTANTPTAGAGEGSWRRPATEQGLREALALLHRRLRPGDLLLVYLTGHGYRMFGHTSLGLQGGSITAGDLMHRLGELPFGKLILIADPCYSGGFVKAAVALGRDVVAVSSADDRHEVRCEPFIRPLWLAAVAAESDTRGNGFVSVEEAFAVAASGLRYSAAGGAGAAGAAGGDAPQLAASGTCAGRENRFSTPPSTSAAAAAAPTAGAATGPTASSVPMAPAASSVPTVPSASAASAATAAPAGSR